MTASLIVVGERMNQATWRPRDWPVAVSHPRYWKLMRRLGAFNDEKSKTKLASLGLTGYDAVNLLPPDPQRSPWDAERAKEVMAAWLDHLRGYDRCFLTGVKVSAAIGLRGRQVGLLGRRSSVCGVRVVVIPHPSGLNRFWNDVAAVWQLRDKLSTIFKGEI